MKKKERKRKRRENVRVGRREKTLEVGVVGTDVVVVNDEVVMRRHFRYVQEKEGERRRARGGRKE